MPTGIRGHAARFMGRTPQLRRFWATGAAADTNITVTGIGLNDDIASVFEYTTAGVFVADRTAVAHVTAPDTIQLTGQTSAANRLDVLYYSNAA